MNIPYDIINYFNENSGTWKKQFGHCTSFVHSERIIKELNVEDASDLLSTAMSYLSSASNEIAVYQEALNKLQQGQSERQVDLWLETVGFKLEHNILGKALIKKFSSIFKSVTQVIHNFIANIVGILNMTLSEIAFNFSISPSITLKFA